MSSSLPRSLCVYATPCHWSCELLFVYVCWVTHDVHMSTLWGTKVSMSWISLQSCVRSYYTCPCTWSRMSLMSWRLPWHSAQCTNTCSLFADACTHICTLCIHQCYFCIVRNAVRGSLGCFPCVRSCGQVIPCPVRVFGGISLCLFFTHWRYTVRLYMSSTYPNWQQAACYGILMLSSCMHESLTMFSLHRLLWSCSRAHRGNTVTQMNRLWNSLYSAWWSCVAQDLVATASQLDIFLIWVGGSWTWQNNGTIQTGICLNYEGFHHLTELAFPVRSTASRHTTDPPATHSSCRT